MNKTIACCLVGLTLAIAIETIYLEWEPPSPPGVTTHQYNRQEAAGPKPPVLASERALEQATAIPSSPSLAQEPLDRQEVTVALASERNLERAAVIPSSPSLAQEAVDRQEVMVAPSPPVPMSPPSE